MRTSRSVLGLLVVVAGIALAASGCVVEAAHDYALTGSWSVNGTPASSTSCAAAGIARIQLAVRVRGSGVIVFQNSSSCSNGSFSAGFVLDAGDFTSQWTAVDSSGTNIGMSGMEDFSTTALAPGSSVMLRMQDFVVTPGAFNPRGTDAPMSAEWQINGMTPSAANCTAAGIANISILFYEATDTARAAGIEVATAACATGKFMSEPTPILRAGTYLTSIQALDAGGTVVASYDAPSPLVVVAGRNHMLMVANFTTAPAGESLDVAFTWDTTVGPTMTDTDCAMAGVGTMTYTLMGAGGAVVNMMADIPCGAGVTFDDALIAPGSYSIYVEGAPPGMPLLKKWMVTCTGLDVALNEQAMYNCAVDKVLP